MISIVTESAEHHDAVRQLTIDAFATSEFGHNGEADLVESIRQDCDEILSLVAIDDQDVVGHILFSPAIIRCRSETLNGMGLAPMAVLPTHQRRGIGSLLVKNGLARLAKLDSAFTVVAGHPDYYPHFGFVPASQFDITHGFAGMPQDVLFVQTEFPDTLLRMLSGKVYYHPAFGLQHTE